MMVRNPAGCAMFDGLIDDNLPGVIKIMMVRNPAESSTIRIKSHVRTIVHFIYYRFGWPPINKTNRSST